MIPRPIQIAAALAAVGLLILCLVALAADVKAGRWPWALLDLGLAGMIAPSVVELVRQARRA